MHEKNFIVGKKYPTKMSSHYSKADRTTDPAKRTLIQMRIFGFTSTNQNLRPLLQQSIQLYNHMSTYLSQVVWNLRKLIACLILRTSASVRHTDGLPNG